MRRAHFEALKPICPRCRSQENVLAPLNLSEVTLENVDFILEGLLVCSNKQCGNEYPIIFGIPIIVPNIREFLKNNFLAITSHTEFSPLIDSVLGDAMGPGAEYNNTRHHISSYGWDHYGDLAPEGEFEDENHAAKPGSAINCLKAGLSLLPQEPQIPILDVGCALGRTSFELAKKCDGLTLGIDINFSKLRIAQRVLQEGVVSFPLKKLGVAFEQHEYPVDFSHKHHVDFWLCNALVLPFSHSTFHFASLLNVLDVVPAPKILLTTISNILSTGGNAVFSTPYDWSPPVSMDSWIGGKKVHQAFKGDSVQILRSLFSTEQQIGEFNKLKIIGEIEHQPWFVRVHKRRIVNYDTHVFACEKL